MDYNDIKIIVHTQNIIGDLQRSVYQETTWPKFRTHFCVGIFYFLTKVNSFETMNLRHSK